MPKKLKVSEYAQQINLQRVISQSIYIILNLDVLDKQFLILRIIVNTKKG